MDLDVQLISKLDTQSSKGMYGVSLILTISVAKGVTGLSAGVTTEFLLSELLGLFGLVFSIHSSF